MQKIPSRGPVGPTPADARSIDRDAPLRLAGAAALAYPFGGMTASGLRREAARGNLAIERTAGKDYVTLAAIDEMRARCRREATAPVFGSSRLGEDVRPTGSPGTADRRLALAAALAAAERLRKLPNSGEFAAQRLPDRPLALAVRPFQFVAALMTRFACMSAKIDAAAFAALESFPTNRAPPALTWPVPTHKLRPLDASIKRALKSVWRRNR